MSTQDILNKIEEWVLKVTGAIINSNERELSQKSCQRLARFASILGLIYTLLLTNEHSTKRDVFYCFPHLFLTQKQSDEIIAAITRFFEISRNQLRIISTPKGLIRGLVKFKLYGHWINCFSKVETRGVSVPAFAEKIGDVVLHPQLQFILVVEKETIFLRLLEEGFFSTFKLAVLLTSRGYPDIPTRMLLSKLASAAAFHSIPFFIASDSDPSGASICATYAIGPYTTKWYQEGMNPPVYRLINCTADEAVNKYGMDPSELQSLSRRDNRMLDTLITRFSALSCNKISNSNCLLPVCYQDWTNYCSEMKKSKRKFELDAIPNIITFLHSRILMKAQQGKININITLEL